MRLENAVSLLESWSQRADLNRGPTDYESVALPAELRWLTLLERIRGRARAGGEISTVVPRRKVGKHKEHLIAVQ